ncbi:MAG: hypothetical protein ACKVJN_11660, partial [Woeseiales bacterium]
MTNVTKRHCVAYRQRDLPASQIQVSVPILVTGKVRYYGRPWPDYSFFINSLSHNNIVTRALESGLF